MKLMACHECDLLHRIADMEDGYKAYCARCGAFLYQRTSGSMDRVLALCLSALFLVMAANAFPFMSLEIGGRVEVNYLFTGAIALYRSGMGEVGLLVFLTSVLFPVIISAGMLYILLPLKCGHHPPAMAQVYRLVKAVAPWSLVSVFMLGVLLSLVKLLDMANIIPGISLYAFIGLIVVLAAAQSNFDPSVVWPDMPLGTDGYKKGGSALENGLISCHTCALLVPKGVDNRPSGSCPRCGSPLHGRKTNSITRTWALILSAGMLFVPANIYPVMTVIQLGQGHPNTILSGVIHLAEEGMWVLSMIIFFASVMVPVLKLMILSFLLISVTGQSTWRLRDRTLLFRATEVIGAWSMVDIYVVAILVGLVNLGNLSTIRPGIGVAFFGAVVVITMFAAHSFDPRLIWDNAKRLK